jgi:cell division inhibitor SulA/protein ImuA
VATDDLITRVWRGSAAAVSRAALPTGFVEIDRYLPGGGWPIGAITEIFVASYGIGELSLLMPAMAALTNDDPSAPPKWVVWIAPPFVPYAPALQQRGVKIERVLMVHPAADRASRCWAIEQVVRSGSSVGVLAWVAAVEDVMLRRLQLAAEQQACWLVLFRPERDHLRRSPAALRLKLVKSERATRVHVLKCRGGRPGAIDIAALDDDSAETPRG